MVSHRPLIALLTTLIALSLTGCASFNRIASYPTAGQPTDVSIVEKNMSKMSELPIGAYYDKERQIIVTGHQKGLFTGMLFGPIGVLVADQANKNAAAQRYGAEAGNAIADLGSVVRDLAVELEKEGRTPQWQLKADASGRLKLSPYAVFTLDKAGSARLYAMLRAEILGADGKPAWSARYFARAPDEYTLDGADGWMKDDRFSAGIKAALRRTLLACIDDTHGKLSDGRKITAKGRYPYVNVPFELRGIVVQEFPDAVTARLVVGDVMVMAGTHILDRADFEIKDASFKDPR